MRRLHVCAAAGQGRCAGGGGGFDVGERGGLRDWRRRGVGRSCWAEPWRGNSGAREDLLERVREEEEVMAEAADLCR